MRSMNWKKNRKEKLREKTVRHVEKRMGGQAFGDELEGMQGRSVGKKQTWRAMRRKGNRDGIKTTESIPNDPQKKRGE